PCGTHRPCSGGFRSSSCSPWPSDRGPFPGITASSSGLSWECWRCSWRSDRCASRFRRHAHRVFRFLSSRRHLAARESSARPGPEEPPERSKDYAEVGPHRRTRRVLKIEPDLLTENLLNVHTLRVRHGGQDRTLVGVAD